MLDIVHHFQQREPVDALDNQERNYRRPQPGNHCAPQHHAVHPGAEHRVLPVQGRQAEFAQAFALQVPGRHGAEPHRTRQESPETFTQARAGRVFRSGDPYMMATVMFGIEVPIEGRSQGDLGQEHFQGLGFVPQLMGGVDGNAGGGPGGHGHAHIRQPADCTVKFSACGDERGGPGQPVRRFQGGRGLQQAAVDDPVDTACGEPTGNDHRRNHKQHAGVDDPAVVALGFKVADRRFGRVADVFAKQAVNQRDQAEDHQHAHPPQLLHACGDGKGAGE